MTMQGMPGGAGKPASVAVLLGAGRGGTTLLYKLLALHRDIAYLSNYQARFPRVPALAALQRPLRGRNALKLAAWFKADGGAYFGGGRQRLKALVPAPVEGEPIYASCGIPLTPAPGQVPDAAACAALASRLEAVRRHAGARVLLTKRTANNQRIGWIDRALPAARYITIVRDGRAVASSLMQVEWWAEGKLFWAGKSPRDLVADGQDELALAARNWVEETELIDAAVQQVAVERVHAVRYEELLACPADVLTGILDFLGLATADDPAFLPAVQSLRLRPAGSPWNRAWTPQQRESVLRIQAPMLARHGYDPQAATC